MSDFHCLRCAKTNSQLAAPPLPGDFGVRVYESTCGDCWQEWLQFQTAIINHHGLNLRDPQAKQFLTQQAEAFLFSPAQPDAP